MNAIEFTFPSDYPDADLRGLTAKGGRACIGKSKADGSVLSVLFETLRSDNRFAKPVFVRADSHPKLELVAKEQVLQDFEVSESHVVDPRLMCGQGLIIRGQDGIACSRGCADMSEAEGNDYSQAFAVVRHPDHGLMAVTGIEFYALGLDEVAGYA